MNLCKEQFTVTGLAVETLTAGEVEATSRLFLSALAIKPPEDVAISS